MLKKIKKILVYALFGLGLASTSCGSNGNEDVKIINQNNKPAIITSSLEDAVAGEYYTKQIETYDLDNEKLILNLINAPEWIVLENNILKGSPIHSKLGPNYSQTGHFDLELSVSDGTDTTFKKLDLFVLDNSSLDYLRTDENIRFVCESGCPFNEDYLDKKSNGVFNAVKMLKEAVQSDANSVYKPADFHLQKDSECTNNYLTYIDVTSDGRYLICNPKNYDTSGNGIEFNSNLSPEDIKNNSPAIHEYFHAITNVTSGKFNESFGTHIAMVLTEGSGYLPGIKSLCGYDPKLVVTPYKLAYYLCNDYKNANGAISFDMKDLPELFRRLKLKPISTVDDAKCITDGIVSKNLGTQTSTNTAFEKSNIILNNTTYCGD